MYTSVLVKKLANEERKKVELWAEGTRHLAQIDNPSQDFSFILQVIRNNETVPVILTDEFGNINATRNLDSVRAQNPDYIARQLKKMKKEQAPIEIILPQGHKNYIYYKDSILITKLIYYPYIQFAVITMFILVSYIAFSYSRKAEQNQVWVGLAKETAHQLGTPISSLMGWAEFMKLDEKNKEIIIEVEKDIARLQIITERFSKIGSPPVLKTEDLLETLKGLASYMKTRVSDKIEFEYFFPKNTIEVPLNSALFGWVIENLFKNSIDAMNGKGKISLIVSEKGKSINIDITDTGKGIPKSTYKTVFKPGYTTKKRGWGLGLSLSHRIIEQYHKGKIFVKNSEIDKGTTFRITLNKT